MNNGGDRFVITSWDTLTQKEKQHLKKKSFTVNPDNWDLTFMAQSNGRNVPDWNRQNSSMRFNHLDKMMLTKMMYNDVKSKNMGQSGLSFSPHEVANYAFHKFKSYK